MAEQEEILAAEIEAGLFESPPDELDGFLADPDCGPPGGADAWLGELASPALDAILDARQEAAGPGAAEVFPPAVITHDGRGPGGPGFSSGSVLDGLEPGPVLAGALDDAWSAGLGGRSDDELAGMALAFRRCESRAAAGLLAATGELARRREAGGDWRVIEHVDAELAALLTLTRRSAGRLLDFATSLARLPATMAALACGRIDRTKADVIAYETGLLDEALAAAVEQLVIDDARALTTSGLAARVRRAVLAADPAAARRRQEKALRDARVELINERSGTAGLAGRDLPVPAALAADQRIDAAARALKAGGAAATLPQLRAAVFLGLLTSQDPLRFLPPSDTDQPDVEQVSDDNAPGKATSDAGPDHNRPSPDPEQAQPEQAQPEQAQPEQAQPEQAQPEQDKSGKAAPGTGPGIATGPDAAAGPLIQRGSVHLTMPLAAWLGLTRSPGDITGFGPATAETCRELADLIAENPGSRWCLTLTDAAGHAVGHACARRPPPTRHNNEPPGQTDRPPGGTNRAAGGPGQSSEATDGPPDGPHRPPSATEDPPGAQDQSPSAAEDPPDSRDRPPPGEEEPPDEPGGPPGGIPRPPRRPPGPPDGATSRLDEMIRWLTGLRTGPIEAGTCSHAREVPGYRIPESLHHIVKTRQRTCSAPWCNRPAIRCDDDHSLPYDQGGRSCECDVAPACRTDHRAKQAPGWRLTQPSPGVLVWELPHGRSYVVIPGVYPT